MNEPKPESGDRKKSIEERLEEVFQNDPEAEKVREIFARAQNRLRGLELSYGADRRAVLQDALNEIMALKRRRR